MMSKDGTNDTYPLYLYGRQGYGSKYIPLLVAFDGYPESNFAQEDTGTAYDLSGAYVSKVVLTTDGFARDPADTEALLPAYGVQYTAPTDLPTPVGAGATLLLGDLVLLLVDNVTHGGDTYGEIYVSDFTSIETLHTNYGCFWQRGYPLHASISYYGIWRRVYDQHWYRPTRHMARFI